MALLVSGLTITLAVANTALLKTLRKGMEWFEYIAGVFVLLTGMYLLLVLLASPTTPSRATP